MSTNRETLKRKSKLDIFIDQIEIREDSIWYEFIESYLCTCTLTEMNQSYEDFINDHPFININEKSLEAKLRGLIKDPDNILA